MVQRQRQSANRRFSPYQLNKVAEFGTIENHENGAGVNIPVFAPQFKAHFARVKTTLTQRYEAAGTDLENTRVIAIKHHSNVEDMQQVKYDGVVYDIQDISPDDENYLAFDYVTINKLTRGGGGSGT